MPFFRWFPAARAFDAYVWREAVAAHDTWERRLAELAPAVVLGTRPMDFGNVRYNAGFFWSDDEGVITVHVKAYLPNEDGAWEATWYDKAVPEFVPATIGDACVGMMIGTELWVMEQAKVYGEDDVQIIAVPRVTSAGPMASTTTADEWLAGGCTAAIISGAYCISSSRDGGPFGDPGWIVSPAGRPLAITSSDEPFISTEVDLAFADKAKETYPRNVIFDVSLHRPASPARPVVQAGLGPA
jgi:N-carbamoylputrescine amidase